MFHINVTAVSSKSTVPGHLSQVSVLTQVLSRFFFLCGCQKGQSWVKLPQNSFFWAQPLCVAVWANSWGSTQHISSIEHKMQCQPVQDIEGQSVCVHVCLSLANSFIHSYCILYHRLASVIWTIFACSPISTCIFNRHSLQSVLTSRQ